jgi:hypothetical protein
MPLFDGRRKTGSWWWQHSLSLTLGALLAIQTAHAVWAGHRVWAAETITHGDRAPAWSSEFWVWWSWEYNVSLVADTFGVILIVLLSKWLYEQGGGESGGEE